MDRMKLKLVQNNGAGDMLSMDKCCVEQPVFEHVKTDHPKLPEVG